MNLLRTTVAALSAAVMVSTGPGIAHAAGHDPAAGGRRCFSVTATHHAKTVLGNTFYDFSQRADWCAESGLVTEVPFRSHSFDDASAYAVFRGLVEDSVTPTPAPEVTSIKKATVENCVPINPLKGCIGAKYPYVRLILRADGSWSEYDGE